MILIALKMIKERQYNTRTNYVAVRSTTGGNRSVVPVPYPLVNLRRIVVSLEQ
jgi:hypothetical protein